jgi:predicted AlkP superfamily phosphohydrolase/phosphomutase
LILKPAGTLFDKPWVAFAPDLVVLPNAGFVLPGSLTPPSQFSSGSALAVPAPEGALWYLRGGVRAETIPALNTKVSILDIAPTILSILGIPIPKEMDGHALV